MSDNVTPIKPVNKSKKPSRTDLISEIMEINSGRSPVILPHKYYTVCDPKGVPLLLAADQDNLDQVRVCSLDLLTRDVMRYTSEIRKPLYPVDADAAKKIAKSVMFLIDPLPEMPQLLKFPSWDGLCFHKVPFDVGGGSEDKIPLFLEMMARTSNADALCAFIGGLFCAGSDKSQYVWIFGEGQNGKSTLLRFLQKILGGCYASEQVPDRQSRFWTYGLLGKRLVAFPDCDSPKFTSTGFFKALTGDDLVRTEGKGKDVYSASLEAKFIFMSNTDPVLKGSKADRRRAIYCEMGEVKEWVSDYEQELWKEAPDIITYCLRKRSELTTSYNSPIKVDDSSYDDITSQYEDRWQGFFDEHFIYNYSASKIAREQIKTTGPDLQMFLAQNLRESEIGEFRVWLKMRYKVRNKTYRKEDGTTAKAYLGIEIKKHPINCYLHSPV